MPAGIYPHILSLKKLDALKILISRFKSGAYRNAPVVKLKMGKVRTPFQLMVACIISQRTRDEQTAKIADALFSVADDPAKIAAIPLPRLKKVLYGCGFYNQKAANIKKSAQIVAKSGMPRDIDGLTSLPGVGRKTANIVLAYSYNVPAIAVDIHVHRISNRIGLVRTKNPEQTETDLCKAVPRRMWIDVNHTLVAHGQTICKPQKPLCHACPIVRLCNFGIKQTSAR